MAQKFNIIELPRRSLSDTLLPSASVNLKSGASLPTCGPTSIAETCFGSVEGVAGGVFSVVAFAAAGSREGSGLGV